MAAGFSWETKDILSRVAVKSRAQKIAELHALIAGLGNLSVGEDGALGLVLQSENLPAVRRADFLLRAVSGAAPDCSCFLSGRDKNTLYTVSLYHSEKLLPVLVACGFMNKQGALRDKEVPAPPSLIRDEACARAFLRGSFLAAGYVSDPRRSYHWEVICAGKARGEALMQLIASLGISARATTRKGKALVYVKDGESIAALLSLMGAYGSTLHWENARVLHSLQGQVNRQVNCETANLAKISRAGQEQASVIRRLKESPCWNELPAPLKEIAAARLENPEISLKELGEMMSPPVGKSGINHRMRKIMQIAEYYGLA